MNSCEINPKPISIKPIFSKTHINNVWFHKLHLPVGFQVLSVKKATYAEVAGGLKGISEKR